MTHRAKANKILQAKPIILTSQDPQIWNQVSGAKQSLIETGNLPDYAEFIAPEIVAMWRRSINLGVEWDQPLLKVQRLTTRDLAVLRERKKLLIDVGSQFVDVFQDIIEATDVTMSITDENGVLLTKARNSDQLWSGMPVNIGDIWSEQNVGCTAHNMAIVYKCPVQIIGPVNYLKILDNNMSSAAPIFNEYGDVVGTINLIQRKADGSRLMTHSLGWVTSVASAITNQLKLFRRDKRLKLMNSTLKAAFAHADEGYVSIDEAGYVIHLNKEASRVLHFPPNTKGLNLFHFLEDQSSIANAMLSGKAIKGQLLQHKGYSQATLIADIEPFQGDRKKPAQGAIIRIREKSDSANPGPLRVRQKITFNDILGKCPAIETLKETARMFSHKPVNILLLGESGAGKEVFAQAIHNSYGESAPFVAINCASIPANLIESELFGYEGGAFTGADKDGKTGKIEYANGGTLFLDEIGDMPLELQPVLLRVLEEKCVTRIGGHRSIPVDFRIISATHRPLHDDILNKKFRQDLYYRLAVVSLEIPPLRERYDDILIIADNLIREICSNFSIQACSLSSDVEQLLVGYSWPGNIRQLQNAMIYAVSMTRDGVIRRENLPNEIVRNASPTYKGKLGTTVRDLEKEVILEVLSKSNTAKEAAQQLGISRATLYRKIKD